MPRQNRRRDDGPRPSAVGAWHRIEQWRGDDYAVRAISGASAVKAYRCPGCDQLIAAGIPHVVAWPNDDPAAGERRHWHTPCWTARDRRAPQRRR